MPCGAKPSAGPWLQTRVMIPEYHVLRNAYWRGWLAWVCLVLFILIILFTVCSQAHALPRRPMDVLVNQSTQEKLVLQAPPVIRAAYRVLNQSQKKIRGNR